MPLPMMGTTLLLLLLVTGMIDEVGGDPYNISCSPTHCINAYQSQYKLNYNEVQDRCQSYGGALLSITSRETQDLIGSFLSKRPADWPNGTWIGAVKSDLGGWYWINGKKFGGQLSLKTEKCGYVTLSATETRYDSTDCLDKLPYLCIINNCNDKSNACLNEGHLSTTWYHAHQDCAATYNSSLLFPLAGNDFRELLLQATVGRYWVGLTTSSWTWMDGSSMNYSNWSPDFPIDGARCLQVGKKGRWQNVDCHSMESTYICSGVPVPVMSTEPSTTSDITKPPDESAGANGRQTAPVSGAAIFLSVVSFLCFTSTGFS